jgi:hypothetical protein
MKQSTNPIQSSQSKIQIGHFLKTKQNKNVKLWYRCLSRPAYKPAGRGIVLRTLMTLRDEAMGGTLGEQNFQPLASQGGQPSFETVLVGDADKNSGQIQILFIFL